MHALIIVLIFKHLLREILGGRTIFNEKTLEISQLRYHKYNVISYISPPSLVPL
jgi:hypothetical protein